MHVDVFTCLHTLEKKLVLRCVCSAPIHSQRKTTQLVSYYAFMIGWLLPSQPPSCQRDFSSFTTHTQLRDLSIQAGLFPFRRLTLAPNVCLHKRDHDGIRSSPERSKALGPHNSIGALPPYDPMYAVPQYISRRTSYFYVWLAFHPLPQVIRVYCHRRRFGLSEGFTPASTCPRQDHAVSGQMNQTDML